MGAVGSIEETKSDPCARAATTEEADAAEVPWWLPFCEALQQDPFLQAFSKDTDLLQRVLRERRETRDLGDLLESGGALRVLRTVTRADYAREFEGRYTLLGASHRRFLQRMLGETGHMIRTTVLPRAVDLTELHPAHTLTAERILGSGEWTRRAEVIAHLWHLFADVEAILTSFCESMDVCLPADTIRALSAVVLLVAAQLLPELTTLSSPPPSLREVFKAQLLQLSGAGFSVLWRNQLALVASDDDAEAAIELLRAAGGGPPDKCKAD